MGELEIFTIRIKELRSSLGMTQRDFCEYIGVSQQSLSGYERGVMKPPLDVVTNIANICNVSIDWLCGLSDQKKQGGELESYSDLIDMFVKLEEYTKFKVSPATISIYDDILKYFFLDWSKMVKLYRDGTIDKKLYTLWLREKKSEYSISLKDENEIKKFLQNRQIENDDN